MNEGEFKIQLLETEPQWTSGLWQRLKPGPKGVSMLTQPSFDSWLVASKWPDRVGDIVVDECGDVYWTAFEPAGPPPSVPQTWRLYRRNSITSHVEQLLDFGTCVNIEPRKMWLRRDHLWILDLREERLLALSRENFQIVREISLKGEVDLAVDEVDFNQDCHFYALIKTPGKERICRYPTSPGNQISCFAPVGWKNPESLAIDAQGILFMLDTGLGRIIRYDPATGDQRFIGGMAEGLLRLIRPSLMEIDPNGLIYLASNVSGEQPARLHLFDQDGSYLGETTRNTCNAIESWNGIPLPEECHQAVEKIGGIGFDARGGVYLATDLGLARFNLGHTPVGQDGVYYSRTLDNGLTEGPWHRIALRGQLPDKTSVEIYYFVSDDEALRKAYDRALSEVGSVEERVASIEMLMQPRWKGPEIFKGDPATLEAAPDMLLLENKGRYLWFKLRLLTFDSGEHPVIKSARIYYQRISYLRYLPPAYREDLVSAAFLERFLSLFETLFHGIEQEIDQLYRYFDPRLTPPEFLPWLASWINLSVDEDLPADRLRLLIQRAPVLYGSKGTPSALQEFLEIYTGKKVVLSEHSRDLRPLVLGSQHFRLGQGSILLGSGYKGLRVGDTSVVGFATLRTKLRGTVREPDEPFLPVLRRFTISIDMESGEFNRRAATLQRIINDQKPAHTACTIELIPTQGTVGGAVLGVNATVDGPQPYQVGITPLGAGITLATGSQNLRLERGAWIGRPLGL